MMYPGGPNAAYFGSLQRLLPTLAKAEVAAKSPTFYRSPSAEMLQYVPEEVLAAETDPLPFSRMQRYWGVATTEL